MPDLSNLIRPGDGVLWGQGTAEPQTLVEEFLAQRAAYPGASAFLGINYSGAVRAEHADQLRFTAYCGTGHNRRLIDAGVADVLPFPFSRFGALIRAGTIRTDVVLVQVSPPNAQGEHSLGLSAEYLIPALETARVVIAEINDQVPWSYTERRLRASDFALSIRSSRAPALGALATPGEIEQRIGAHAARFVPDGATLECGIGAVPDAVLAALADRRDLGMHSGSLGDGIVELMQRGVITNARKPIDAGKTIGGVLLGTRILFDFVDRNPAVELRTSDYTHGAAVLARLPAFVAINSAVEVDLTGQVNAEIANGAYVGAVGGAPDFIRAANDSPGGVSLICLPASVGTKASRIVGRLSGPVATPRAEAGVVVTQYGAADLRGLPLRARAARMLAIAHPAFRESLEREAHALGLSQA
jgi:acyl-CoA hydrolase